MPTINYWDGTRWVPIGSAGDGGGGGTPGPQGPPGESVNVYGPQVAQPVPQRKGDVWLAEAAERSTEPVASLVEPPSPSPYVELIDVIDRPENYPTLAEGA